jgi:hypothetical protein
MGGTRPGVREPRLLAAGDWATKLAEAANPYDCPGLLYISFA